MRIGLVMMMVLLGACGAGNGLKKSNGNGQRVQGEGAWPYKILYSPPEVEGGLWQRRIRLLNADCRDVAIDKLKEGQTNWFEMGFTNDDCEYVDQDSTGNVRYRINGEVVTGLIQEERDQIITALTANEFHGERCIVPVGAVIYVLDGKLELNCREIFIRGHIVSFRQPPFTSFGMLNKKRKGGTVVINTNIIEVRGMINMAGEIGYKSGDGGLVEIQYATLRATPDAVRADAGPLYSLQPNFPANTWQPVAGIGGIVTLHQRPVTESIYN